MATGRTQNAADGTDAGRDQRPPDIETMRDSARILLTEGAEPPAPDKLDTLTVALRGHIHLLIPEVANAAAREPKDSIPKYCALACIGEAHTKLRLDDDSALPVLALARKLARVVNALCDHYENLNDVRPAAGR
ncbi:DUF6415 family natural product biosynthesis protein [Streptomyces sp. ADMS]|uniref:DUF6415 family natural product biosynthesis protein n=1 Tax=Streptomyces sp. ADMS TaxID=3071415 RepID=UPI00296F519B|nr:DUF6415 family natural product biosynthesis protein [Streptomyces sp. ADMS]MDW4908980.1 DUF6415 family natural product biosynthesis protein [Streptomyces sp. ADMS]